MAATERNDRNAIDQLLFKMARDGEIKRLRRGVYALNQDVGKIDKKERKEVQTADCEKETGDLTNLTGLTDILGSRGGIGLHSVGERRQDDNPVIPSPRHLAASASEELPR
jgi:hypothetical protein